MIHEGGNDITLKLPYLDKVIAEDRTMGEGFSNTKREEEQSNFFDQINAQKTSNFKSTVFDVKHEDDHEALDIE